MNYSFSSLIFIASSAFLISNNFAHNEIQNNGIETMSNSPSVTMKLILDADESTEFFTLGAIKNVAQNGMTCYAFYEDHLKSARTTYEDYATRKKNLSWEEVQQMAYAREQKTMQTFKSHMKIEDPSCKWILVTPKSR